MFIAEHRQTQSDAHIHTQIHTNTPVKTHRFANRNILPTNKYNYTHTHKHNCRNKAPDIHSHSQMYL